MPGLKQAGRIANDRLVKHLAPHGYYPVKHTASLWKHKTNSITFALVVDDFGVKHSNPKDFEHLLQSLEGLYTVTVDRTGSKYLGLTIDWNYIGPHKHVDISMPDYVSAALHKFRHESPPRPSHSPHAWNKPTYGSTSQLVPDDDVSPYLPKSQVRHIHAIVGTFLYYAIAIDLSMRVALGLIASTQTEPTKHTMQQIADFLNYASTHPDAKIRYRPSDMILHLHSDASYLSEKAARSRAAGIYFLGPRPLDPTLPPTPSIVPNGTIHALSKILSNVMSSAAEAEIASTFLTARDALPLRVALDELGHPQPPTPIQVDNTTAVGFANNRIKQKATKAIDMRFHWIRDRVSQNQFLIYWGPGGGNYADYISKHHSPAHHTTMRSKFFVNRVVCTNNVILCLLRGCNNPYRITAPRDH